MKRALARANIALIVVLTSPVVAFAGGFGDDETILDWFFRLLRWAAGGWHGF